MFYAGAGPNVCHTAFAGVALECPVAMRCSRLLLTLLAELKAV
jgi:hypothetical protein